jgi:hypothetical protein
MGEKTENPNPSRRVLLQRKNVKRYYQKHRAKILEKKKKKELLAKSIANNNKNAASFQDIESKQRPNQENYDPASWQETRNRQEAPLSDPRLDAPPRIQIKPAVASFIGILQKKNVNLFKNVESHAKGAMRDEKMPDI